MDKYQALYAVIKEELLDRIKTGQYKKGDQIPTELELCEEFNASRTTVRVALNQLTMEGYLIRQQGRGTYVAGQKVKQTLSHTIKRYSDQIAVQGKEAKISLISLTVVPANELLERTLNVKTNTPIQRIERVRSANDEPTQYEIAYIPWDVAPGITKEHAEHSIYASLADHFNVHIGKTTEQIEILLADERASIHLQCEEGLPCFYIETIAEDHQENIVEFSRAYFRGDKTNFMIERMYPED